MAPVNSAASETMANLELMISMLTILTSPPGWKACFKMRRGSGHFGVTRSLLNGMDRLGVPYLYNPRLSWSCSKDVLALAGIDTLASAIRLKESGKISFLAAGPNISVLPSCDAHLLAHPAVDVCVVPSGWVKNLYIKDSPSLQSRIEVCYSGVDEFYWMPDEGVDRKSCLVYVKSADAPQDATIALLQRLRIPYSVLSYGTHTQSNYRDALRASRCVIMLSRTESQGLALAEAWAMDVPTFSWNPGVWSYGGYEYEGAHAAPYLGPSTGGTWNSMDELEGLMQNMFSNKAAYDPRQWVIQNMTDVHAARHFLACFERTEDICA